MSKTMQWVIGILAVLALGTMVTFLILWDKEKKKNGKPTGIKKSSGVTGGVYGVGDSTKGYWKDDEWYSYVDAGAAAVAVTSRMKSGIKRAIIRGEVCEWDGSNWVNCKKLASA